MPNPKQLYKKSGKVEIIAKSGKGFTLEGVKKKDGESMWFNFDPAKLASPVKGQVVAFEYTYNDKNGYSWIQKFHGSKPPVEREPEYEPPFDESAMPDIDEDDGVILHEKGNGKETENLATRDKDKWIAKQVCLKAAATNCSGVGADPKTVVDMARYFFEKFFND